MDLTGKTTGPRAGEGFSAHARACPLCRACPGAPCPEGARRLLEEMLPRMTDVARAQRAELRRGGASRFPRGPGR